ncbi:hypothetical protein CEXT_371321 [Caerostris extrusa]|uniref:LAGLIDADG homing endonuclease n=1 Tax=Caerostris extrusa TaxID=172846 RepID=A0AAV4W0G6_CAEEX|nr:hypothetical protein CEXT_371321 [Caerostris extrusa]
MKNLDYEKYLKLGVGLTRKPDIPSIKFARVIRECNLLFLLVFILISGGIKQVKLSPKRTMTKNIFYNFNIYQNPEKFSDVLNRKKQSWLVGGVMSHKNQC